MEARDIGMMYEDLPVGAWFWGSLNQIGIKFQNELSTLHWVAAIKVGSEGGIDQVIKLS
jgi:hypothetical protein